ncbi:MAG: hypothetical protein NUV69_04785 [Candidatus Curtissbacteria bacterium]|nr:hypothetical protein [Candidatus Curtissbacteria bacterium]
MKSYLPEDDDAPIRKRNRVKRLAPKQHKIVHESGRSTKTLWQQIIERSEKK